MNHKHKINNVELDIHNLENQLNQKKIELSSLIKEMHSSCTHTFVIEREDHTYGQRFKVCSKCNFTPF